MLKKFFAVFVTCFALCASASAEELYNTPIVTVENFKVVGDSPFKLGELTSDLIIERLVDSQKFSVLEYSQEAEVRQDKKFEPDYLVKGTIEIQKPKASVIKVIVDFELVKAKTNELVWGRRVWEENEFVPKNKITIIHDTIYRTADKVVGRLVADMDSGKIF